MKNAFEKRACIRVVACEVRRPVRQWSNPDIEYDSIMRVAFHFIEDQSLGWPRPLIEVIRSIQGVLRDNEQTKLFAGTVLFARPAAVRKRASTGEVVRADQGALKLVIERWKNTERERFSTLKETAEGAARLFEVFAVLAETLAAWHARSACNQLRSATGYLGAREVDNADPIDQSIYALIPRVRVRRDSVSVFWDGVSEDSKDEWLLHAVDAADVGPVSFESLGGRYSIVDSHHTADANKRRAAWSRVISEHFAYLVENAVSVLGDAAPDLADKLWAALDTFTRAETNEQYAQVAVSCRRIIEYCADSVFPPCEPSDGSHKLGPKHYRNRLLAFADQERRSSTDIDLIVVGTTTLAEQIERLEHAVNKGVHSEVAYGACRRCLIRSVIFLDDLASLKSSPFDITIQPDRDLLCRILGMSSGQGQN
jgi:hypothetical protein